MSANAKADAAAPDSKQSQGKSNGKGKDKPQQPQDAKDHAKPQAGKDQGQDKSKGQGGKGAAKGGKQAGAGGGAKAGVSQADRAHSHGQASGHAPPKPEDVRPFGVLCHAPTPPLLDRLHRALRAAYVPVAALGLGPLTPDAVRAYAARFVDPYRREYALAVAYEVSTPAQRTPNHNHKDARALSAACASAGVRVVDSRAPPPAPDGAGSDGKAHTTRAPTKPRAEAALLAAASPEAAQLAAAEAARAAAATAAAAAGAGAGAGASAAAGPAAVARSADDADADADAAAVDAFVTDVVCDAIRGYRNPAGVAEKQRWIHWVPVRGPLPVMPHLLLPPTTTALATAPAASTAGAAATNATVAAETDAKAAAVAAAADADAKQQPASADAGNGSTSGARVGRFALWHRPSFRDVQAAAAHGATCIVTCQAASEQPQDVARACAAVGLAHVWVDLPGANMAVLERNAPSVQRGLAEVYERVTVHGDRVLIHCAAGLHRTGAFGFALLRLCGASPPAAKMALTLARKVTAEQAGLHRLALADTVLLQGLWTRLGLVDRHVPSADVWLLARSGGVKALRKAVRAVDALAPKDLTNAALATAASVPATKPAPGTGAGTSAAARKTKPTVKPAAKAKADASKSKATAGAAVGDDGKSASAEAAVDADG